MKVGQGTGLQSHFPGDLLASKCKGEGVSMPPASEQRLGSVNTTTSTREEQQCGQKSRWQAWGGVMKAAKRIGQDSEDRLRLQTDGGEKLGRPCWLQLQGELGSQGRCVPRGDQGTRGHGFLRKSTFSVLTCFCCPCTHLCPNGIGPFLEGSTLGTPNSKFQTNNSQ